MKTGTATTAAILGTVVLNVNMSDKPANVLKKIGEFAEAGIQVTAPKRGPGRPRSADAKVEEEAGPYELAWLKVKPSIKRVRCLDNRSREEQARHNLQKHFGPNFDLKSVV